MSEARWLKATERWLSLLLWLYPTDFREEMGPALVEAYRDQARRALRSGGRSGLARVWLRALADSLRNGLGERLRPAIRWRRTGDWGRDAEHVLRRLVRAPAFVLAMVGTLTVGLGAFGVVSAVVQKVLLAPLPYPHAEDLHFIWRDYKWIPLERAWLAGTDVVALREAAGVIQGVVALRRETATFSSAGAAEPQELPVMVSTANLFEVLGVRPALGRGFAPEEEGPGRPPVIVLGHSLWRERYGSDPAILGREVRLDGEPFTVIGVMAEGFRFQRHSSLGPPESAEGYTTFDIALSKTSPRSGAYAGLLRARPGTSPEVLAQAIGAVGSVIDARDMRSRGLRLYPVAAKEDLVAAVRPALEVLGLAGGVLMLVLTVNLATLLLVRAAQREREFAICRALGADALVVARATLLEGGLLGLLGGTLGALVAVWGTRVVATLAPLDLPRRESIEMDAGLIALVVAVGTLSGLLSGAVPALWGTQRRLGALLGNAAVQGGGASGRVRRGMVVLQVALSLVLLGTGGLVVRSFDRLLRIRPGFDPSGVLTVRVPVFGAQYGDEAAVTSLHQRLQSELAALRGVRTVGAASALPLTAGTDQTSVSFPGAPGNTGNAEQDAPLVDYLSARPGYFEALGIRVLEGRSFDDAAPAEGTEAVIDRSLAARFFPSGSALGAVIKLRGQEARVIGVVEHARQYDIYKDGRPQLYLRNAGQALFGTLSWVVRTDGDPLERVADMRAALRRVDPQLALADLRSMDQVVDESLRQQKLSAVLLGGFSLGALLLAATGLYGMVAAAVGRRRHELAVRIALGASHRKVLRLVLGEGAVLVLLGLLLGAPGLYVMGRVARGMLLGISAFDPLTLAGVALGLGGVAIFACYLPARQVVKIDPASALRQE